MRFQNSVRPTLPGVSVAPITATRSGAKKTSSGCCLPRKMSCADSNLAAAGGFITSFSSLSINRQDGMAASELEFHTTYTIPATPEQFSYRWIGSLTGQEVLTKRWLGDGSKSCQRSP